MRAAPPTLIDRVVGYFSPAAGLDRLKNRTLLMAASGEGGFKGGRRDRRPTRNWRPGEGSADADTLGDLPDLRARSRDLARNTPIATGAIATTTTNVIGDGLQLQANIDAEALNITPEQADEMEREQEREFAEWCRTCDFTRVQPFDELQTLAFRSVKESGDVLIVRRYRRDPGDVYGTKLQLLEADRLSNPNRVADTDRLAGGVETDGDGVPIAFHISNRHPGNLRLLDLKWERVPARAEDGRPVVLHLYERTRPELTRGVPYLAPVIEHLKQLGDYSDAEVTAAVVSAMFTVAVESPINDDGAPPIGETDSSLEANELKLGAGAVWSGAPGEKFTSINPSRPNANFDPFVQAFLRQIGVALELPFELLIKHFTASYSASKAALEMARMYFRKQRLWFAYRFCHEVYGWFLEEAVATGRLARPGFFEDPVMRAAYSGAEWIGPATPSLNPKMEAEADALDFANGFKTGEEICISRTGGEYEKKIAQRGKEETLRREAGIVPEPAPSQGASSAPSDDGDPGDDNVGNGDPADDSPDAPPDRPSQAATRRFVIYRPDGAHIRGEVA